MCCLLWETRPISLIQDDLVYHRTVQTGIHLLFVSFKRITSVKKHMFSVKDLVKIVFALYKHKVFFQLTSNGIYWHGLHKKTESDEASLYSVFHFNHYLTRGRRLSEPAFLTSSFTFSSHHLQSFAALPCSRASCIGKLEHYHYLHTFVHPFPSAGCAPSRICL